MVGVFLNPCPYIPPFHPPGSYGRIHFWPQETLTASLYPFFLSGHQSLDLGAPCISSSIARPYHLMHSSLFNRPLLFCIVSQTIEYFTILIFVLYHGLLYTCHGSTTTGFSLYILFFAFFRRCGCIVAFLDCPVHLCNNSPGYFYFFFRTLTSSAFTCCSHILIKSN